MAKQYSVWSWDANHGLWMEVAEGTKREMTDALERKQRAAAKYLPGARFTMTSKGEPPTEAPDD